MGSASRREALCPSQELAFLSQAVGYPWHFWPVDHQKSDYGGRAGGRRGNLPTKINQHRFASMGRNLPASGPPSLLLGDVDATTVVCGIFLGSTANAHMYQRPAYCVVFLRTEIKRKSWQNSQRVLFFLYFSNARSWFLKPSLARHQPAARNALTRSSWPRAGREQPGQARGYPGKSGAGA